VYFPVSEMGGEKYLKKLLSENRDYVRVLENDKVQCLLSKHEMSNKFDAVSQYLRWVSCELGQLGINTMHGNTRGAHTGKRCSRILWCEVLVEMPTPDLRGPASSYLKSLFIYDHDMS
jgi:hypothetical protein